MSRREEAKEARMIIETAGFGDCISLEFWPDTEPPLAAIVTDGRLFSAIPDDEIVKLLKAATAAGEVLESYGWEVNY